MADPVSSPNASMIPWRSLRGVYDGVPPNEIARSRSQGDMAKNSYRDSGFPGLFTLAISNDDGTSIAASTDELLVELINQVKILYQEMRQLNSQFAELLRLE